MGGNTSRLYLQLQIIGAGPTYLQQAATQPAAAAAAAAAFSVLLSRNGIELKGLACPPLCFFSLSLPSTATPSSFELLLLRLCWLLYMHSSSSSSNCNSSSSSRSSSSTSSSRSNRGAESSLKVLALAACGVYAHLCAV